MCRKRTLDDRDYDDRDFQHTRPMPPPTQPVFVPSLPPQPIMLARAFGLRGPPPCIPGTCFNCLQMGQLSAQCPMGTTRPYPLNDVLLTSVDSSMGNKNDEIIIPHKAIDCNLADTTHSSAYNTPLN